MNYSITKLFDRYIALKMLGDNAPAELFSAEEDLKYELERMAAAADLLTNIKMLLNSSPEL